MRLAAPWGWSVFWRWFDEGLRLRAGVGLAAARQAADRPDGHVVIAQHLTRETNAGRLVLGECGRLGLGVRLRLAGDEFDPAGRAASAPATTMQLIDACILR